MSSAPNRYPVVLLLIAGFVALCCINADSVAGDPPGYHIVRNELDSTITEAFFKEALERKSVRYSGTSKQLKGHCKETTINDEQYTRRCSYSVVGSVSGPHFWSSDVSVLCNITTILRSTRRGALPLTTDTECKPTGNLVSSPEKASSVTKNAEMPRAAQEGGPENSAEGAPSADYRESGGAGGATSR